MKKLTKLSIVGVTIASFLSTNVAYSLPNPHKGANHHKAAPAGKVPAKKSDNEIKSNNLIIVPPVPKI